MILVEDMSLGDSIYRVVRGKKNGQRIEKKLDGETWYRYMDQDYDAVLEYKVIGKCLCVLEGDIISEFDCDTFLEVQYVRIVTSSGSAVMLDDYVKYNRSTRCYDKEYNVFDNYEEAFQYFLLPKGE